jgi:hypothetical protein
MEESCPVSFEPQPSIARPSAEGNPAGVSAANQMSRIYTTMHRGGVVQNHLISFRVSSCDWWFKSLLRL